MAEFSDRFRAGANPGCFVCDGLAQSQERGGTRNDSADTEAKVWQKARNTCQYTRKGI